VSIYAVRRLVPAPSLLRKFPDTRLPAVVLCAALLLIGACSGDGPTEPNSGPTPQATLECEKEGYPCSLSEVPLEILEQSNALADSALAMLDDGASAAEVAVWLENQSGMAEVQSDDLAVRFRLDGGRGTWILLEGATAPFAPGSGPAGSGFAPPDIERAKSDESGVDRVIVGENLEHKKALVLSPVRYDLGPGDEGDAVAAILASTRGYEGGVHHLSNDSEASTEVGVGSFEGWGQYQVVYVTTHGKRMCDSTGCRGIIVGTTLEAILPGSGQTAAEKTKSLKAQGLAVVKSTHQPNTTYVAITADFMRAHYQSGLDNTVVVLSACQTFASQGTDLVESLLGSSSVVFGWDESVWSDDAFAAGVALFNDLSEGYPAEVAYERLGNLRFGRATPHGPPPTLIIGNRPKGGDLRIREVVELLDPQTGLELSPSSFVPIEGVVKDGLDDGAPYSVRVDGMTPDLAATAVLHVSVDGVEADPTPVSEGTVDDHDRWTILGIVPLGYDLEQDKAVTYRAWVELPDEGESKDETTATITGEEPLMGRTWELTAVDSAYYLMPPGTPQVSTAHLILSFEPGQDAEEPNPRYVVTGGTVTYDYNFTYGGCTHTGGITFEVTDTITSDSHITFNTMTTPVTYWGWVSTVGPEFETIAHCGDEDITRMQGATDTWVYLPEPGDAQEVSADNRTITGVYDKSSGGTTWTFIYFSRYTITRLE
jgi:hypothetical protein